MPSQTTKLLLHLANPLLKFVPVLLLLLGPFHLIVVLVVSLLEHRDGSGQKRSNTQRTSENEPTNLLHRQESTTLAAGRNRHGAGIMPIPPGPWLPLHAEPHQAHPEAIGIVLAPVNLMKHDDFHLAPLA